MIAVSMRLRFSKWLLYCWIQGAVHTGVGFWPFYNILLTLGMHCDHYTTLTMSITRALEALQEQKETVSEQFHDSLQLPLSSLSRENYLLLQCALKGAGKMQSKKCKLGA